MTYTGPLYAVRSMAVSKAFYQEVMGQEVILDFGANVTFKSGFSLQEGFAQLADFSEEKIIWGAHTGELYFETEDLDGDEAKVRAAGVTLLHAVKEYPWGQRVMRFYDPDGHVIELADSMRSVVLRFLAQGMSEEEVSARTQHPIEFIQHCKDPIQK